MSPTTWKMCPNGCDTATHGVFGPLGKYMLNFVQIGVKLIKLLNKTFQLEIHKGPIFCNLYKYNSECE